METLAGLGDLVLWKSPPATLAIFAIYMYGLYKGWLVTLALLLILLQLSVNYIASQR